MKYVLLFLICWLLPTLILAQSKGCSDAESDSALRAGDKAKNHQEAYQQYDFAERVACASELKKKAKEKKQQLFNRIERLRIVADSAKEKARREAERATQLKDTAEVLARRAIEEQEITEKALNLLRAARDSASQARQGQQRSEAIVESNEWLDSGKRHLKSKDYDKAIQDYQKGIAVLDSLFITDPLLQSKIDLLLKEIKEADSLKLQFSNFYCYINL